MESFLAAYNLLKKSQDKVMKFTIMTLLLLVSCGNDSFEVVSITDVANRGEEYIVETIQGEQSGKPIKRGSED